MKRSEAVKITECNQKQSEQKLLGKWHQVTCSMQSFHKTQVCKKKNYSVFVKCNKVNCNKASYACTSKGWICESYSV